MVEEDVDVPSIVEELLPPSHDRYVVLRQFLDTVATASAQSPTVWSATLLTKKPGFKINVGGVEVFWFTAGLLHMNLLGEPPSELHDSGSIMAAKYASVPQPQYHFFGDVSMFEQMRGILQPLHEAFVDLACYTPSGNLFKASKFARFHCKELVDYQRLPGIYDIALRVSSHTGRDTELGVLVALSGVPFEPAMGFLRHFLESIKWIG